MPKRLKRKLIDPKKLPPNTWLGRTGSNGGAGTMYRAILHESFTGGAKRRKDCKTVEEALQWIKDAERDRRAVVEAELTYDEVSAAKRATARLRSAGVTLDAVVDYYFNHGPGDRPAIKMSVAIELHLANLAEAGNQEKYVAAQEIALNVFLTTAGDHSIFHYTPERLKAWHEKQTAERKWGPVSQHNYHRDLAMLFHFMVRRKMIPENPMRSPIFDSIAKLKAKTDAARSVEIHTPDEVAKLLRAAMELPHLNLLPRLILQFFSGMRADEIDRASWGIVLTDQKEISLKKGDVSKGGKARNIPFSDALAAWLDLIPENLRTGRIVEPKGLRLRIDKLYTHAKVKKLRNAPRHTFASHDYATHRNADTTRDKLGHNDPDSLFKHYISLVTTKQAKAFFALRPPTDVIPHPSPTDWRSKPRRRLKKVHAS